MYYLKTQLFDVRFILFFLLFIMGAYFPFFPIWLHDINHISKSDTGIIFAAISLFSLLFQPLFGLLFLTNSGCANTCCGLLPAC
ncbi:MFS transporter (plasmid) [Klebsiella pneumoniae]|uniref:MFS transporter n=1 Tax=Klebsiella pneumoniae TaxID=573 RepID=UPI002363D173|nr:MFS transporter [Klebsiella pneumoniae]